MSPAFGEKVIVRHETLRVNRRVSNGVASFWQSTRSRERFRFNQRDLSSEADWPGVAVPVEWERADARFVLEPVGEGPVTVRLRRVPLPHPEVGVVIGTTHKYEGTVYESPGVSLEGDPPERKLGGPGRRVTLHEVALPPVRGKARIVLVHPRDLLAMPDAP